MRKYKQKIKIGVCNYHLCRKRTKVFLCKYCERYFCKQHIKPKPVLTLSQVSTAREPLRSRLEEIWRSKEGHPDYVFTPIFWGRLEREEKERLEKTWETFNRLKEREPEVSEKEDKYVVEPKKEYISIKERYEKPKLVKLGKLFLILIIILALGVLGWYLFGKGNLNIANIIHSEEEIKEVENICTSQVNEVLEVVKSKLPQETKVSIINVKKFVAGDDVLSWYQIYISTPLGLEPKNCNTSWDVEIYPPCADLIEIENKSETYPKDQVIGVGVAIKKEAVELGGHYSWVFPIFCNEDGNLLSNSKNFLLGLK